MADFGLSKKQVTTGVGSTPVAMELATTLANALRAGRKVQRRVDVSKWVKPMQALVDAHTKEEVSQVLEWYTANLDKEFTPQAYSARSFKEKYPAILKASSLQPVQVPVSKLAQEIVEILTIKHWPKGSATQLPNVVQHSLDNYVVFLKKLRALREANDDLIMESWLRYLTDNLHTPVNHVTLWFEDIWLDYHRFERWTGNLTPSIWTPEHGRFSGKMCDLSNKWAGDERRWTRTLELLKDIKLEDAKV